MKQNYPSIAKVLYELSNLNHIPRSGLIQFCFEDFESIAVHSYKVSFIAYFLAQIIGADLQKVLTMALFHDASETRVGDSNWIQKKYIKRDEKAAVTDQYVDLPSKIKDGLVSTIREYEERQSLESKIVKDADYIAYFITLKELALKGNQEAITRLEYETVNFDYLFNEESKVLLKEVLSTDPNSWTRELHKGTLKKSSQVK